jgi:endoglucanase
VKLLERLINAHGVSGNEQEVRKIIIEAIRPLVNDVQIDPAGNLIARKFGQGPAFMLAAHMDEIGLMVREITDQGLLLCAEVGGIIPAAIVGTRVTVQGRKERIHGIITTREISCGEDMEEATAIEDLIVDTGLSKEKLQKLGVTVGAFLQPTKETNWLTYGNTISGKALDNRLGCYCLAEIARRLRRLDREVYYVFTVQEEVGLQGARTSAFSIRPQWAIVVDTTAANDLSAESEKAAGTHLLLGKGPCILHMEEGFIPNANLVRALQQVADANGINVQHEVSTETSTDASKISAVRQGVASANIGVPIRNFHTMVEIANRKDVENTIRLVTELIKCPPPSLCKSTTAPESRQSRVQKSRKKKTGKTPGKMIW